MAFEKNVPEWQAPGVEPPASKKEAGWEVGDRPPAAWLDWFFHGTSEAITELQMKAAEQAWVQQQLEGISVPAASLTQPGIVQLSSATDSDAENIAATPKAVKAAYAVANVAKTTANAANTTATTAESKANDAIAQLAEKAAAADVGNKADLQTANKTNLVAAVNELFTSAGNGKSDWASVIGSPLAVSDTFAQLKSKTQIIKDTMAANLSAKGQTSTGAEALAQLVSKIGQIFQGKKFASGDATCSSMEQQYTRYTSNPSGVAGSWLYDLTITGLTFTPSLIFIYTPGAIAGTSYFTIYKAEMNFAGLVDADILFIQINIGSSIGAGNGQVVKYMSPAFVNSTGFCLPVSGGASRAVSWIAIE
ncbi:phage tail protein [Paenibacillus macerans]|uniref:phage tail protein n=1 Tax=Paenibacillus macerans TaxID=44252 RepID=UPI003D320CC9